MPAAESQKIEPSELSRLTTTVEPHPSVASAIAACIADIKSVAKTGYNQFGRYAYATDADVMQAVRDAMAKHGIAVVMSAVRDVDRTGRMSRKNEAEQGFSAIFCFTVHHADSNQTMQMEVPGSGYDSGEKAAYKAVTGAKKYAMMVLFALAIGDADPENDGGKKPSKDGDGHDEPMCSIKESNEYATLVERATRLQLQRVGGKPHEVMELASEVKTFVGAPEELLNKYIAHMSERPLKTQADEVKKLAQDLAVPDAKITAVCTRRFKTKQFRELTTAQAGELIQYLKECLDKNVAPE